MVLQSGVYTKYGCCQAAITNLLSVFFEAINPGVADAITKLLLLAPKDRLRQIGVRRVIEGFSQNVLLHLLMLTIWQVLHVNLYKNYSMDAVEVVVQIMISHDDRHDVIYYMVICLAWELILARGFERNSSLTSR